MTFQKYTPLELMKMAIEESHLSIPEHTNKTDPMVGAIIATSEGKLLAKAHRGELREGEHCEFTLIERKLASANLKDCVLYVTLEPCTDDARRNHKRGCSTHIGRARLKKVYVGVEDPNPKIAGIGIKSLCNKGIEIEMFPAELQEIIWSDNAEFKKEKEAEALQVLLESADKIVEISSLPITGADLNSFSELAIMRFIEESSAKFKYPSEEFNAWALEFGILEKIGTNEEMKPTGLGVLLFGKNPETYFPQSLFKVEINYGGGNPEVRDFKGPLVTLLPDVMDYVKDKGLKMTMDKSTGTRREQPDFPFEVLLEAVANAVIHRDYTMEGATNYLYIDPDKIIIRSPGAPPYPLTLNDMKSFDAPSISRNPKIMFVFNQIHFAEQRGIGLRNMKHLPDSGFPLPTFRMKAGLLEVTFGRTSNYLKQLAKLDEKVKLTDLDESVLLFVQQRVEVSSGDLASGLNVNVKAAQRALNRLTNLKLLVKKGSKRGTRFYLA